jgi:hypothetical protein
MMPGPPPESEASGQGMSNDNQPGQGQGPLALLQALKAKRHKRVERTKLRHRKRGKNA